MLLHGASKTVMVICGESHSSEGLPKPLSSARIGREVTKDTLKENVESLFYRVFKENDVAELRSLFGSSGRLKFMDWLTWGKST